MQMSENVGHQTHFIVLHSSTMTVFNLFICKSVRPGLTLLRWRQEDLLRLGLCLRQLSLLGLLLLSLQNLLLLRVKAIHRLGLHQLTLPQLLSKQHAGLKINRRSGRHVEIHHNTKHLTVLSSIRTCSSTPSSRKSSRTSLMTSSITDLYSLGYNASKQNVNSSNY